MAARRGVACHDVERRGSFRGYFVLGVLRHGRINQFPITTPALEASMTSPWRFGIVLRRPQTWQLWEPTSSRGDIGVSSALAELLFVEIQPKSMQLARSCALRVARPMRTVIVRVHMHTRAIKRTNRLRMTRFAITLLHLPCRTVKELYWPLIEPYVQRMRQICTS